MAKKTKGLNLAGSADPSIVQAATKYGFAGVPKDLSKQFGMIAQGYSQQMAAFGQIGAKLGAVAGQLALPLIDKAVDNIRFQHGKVGKTPGDVEQKEVEILENNVVNIKAGLRGDVNSEFVKTHWDEIFPTLKGQYETTDLSTLDDSQIKKIKNQAKLYKNSWIKTANDLRAANIKSDYNNANMSPWMKQGKNNDQLLFSTALQFNGKPISKDRNENFQGVQRLPVMKDGEIKFGLYKEVGGELKEIAGIDINNELEFVGQGDHGKPHMVRSTDEFEKDFIVESQFRPSVNAFYGTTVNNALKSIKYDKQAVISDLNMLKGANGEPFTTNDMKDISTVHLAGASGSWSDHLSTINATTAQAFIDANPSVITHLEDLNNNGNVSDDYSTDPNNGEKYNNLINALASDKDAFFDWYAGELQTTHGRYMPTPPSIPPSSSPTTGTERAQSSFVNKIATGEPTVSLGAGNPTWTRATIDGSNIYLAGDTGFDPGSDEAEFYFTKMTDGTYEVRSAYSLNADFGGTQSLGSDNKRFKTGAFSSELKTRIQNTLLEQDPEYQTQLKEQELKIQTEERDVFMRDVFSSHPDFAKGAIAKNKGHEDKAISFFETRYPGMNYVTSYGSRDQLTVSVPNEPSVSFKVNLDSSSYISLLQKFEKWYQANKPNIGG